MIRSPSKETCVLVLGLAALAGGLGSRRLFQTTDGVKNVVVAPNGHDFGTVRQGLTLENTFRMANGGDVAIVITKTESSCGCTTVGNLEGRTIAPGDVLAVPVSLSTGPGDGPESGQITLYYRSTARTDSTVHNVLARVSAVVYPDYRVRPTLIDLGTIDHSGPVSMTVRLRPEARADVAIVRIFCTNEVLSGRQVVAPAGDRDLYIELTFSGRSLWKSQPIEATASIETTSVGCRNAQVLVKGQFVAPVEVEPTSIVISSESPGPVDREIRIDATRTTRIVAFACTDPAVRLVVIGPGEGKALRVMATIAGGDPRRAINAEVSIDLASTTGTDASGARTVKIPIHRLASKE